MGHFNPGTWQDTFVGVDEYPDHPVVEASQLAPVGGLTGGGLGMNTPDVAYSVFQLGYIPNYGDQGQEFIAQTTARPSSDVPLPCRGVNEDVSFPIWGESPHIHSHENIRGQYGVVHGQPQGLASTPLHPVNNTPVPPPAPYNANVKNWLYE